MTSAGINYADTRAATNDYLAPQTLPFIPGSEVAGRVIKSPGGKGAGDDFTPALPQSRPSEGP